MDEKLKILISANVDGVKKGCQEASSQLEKFGKLGKKALDSLGSVAKTAGKAMATAITSAVAASVAALGKIGVSAIKSYGDYEQLAGGVKTLFKESSSTVQKYANEAYKNAGLTANQYMETITGFSASLLQSLGGDTAAAAEYGNQAVIDMSDNANKMGTSMESIQNAYQGFAKQNYTMLDNLKLGYGGTKEEMNRLLADAEKLTGKKFDVSNFADITEAIHAIQTEMGISNAAAEEASSTLQGSFNSMKSSWENLKVAFVAGGDNIGQSITQVVDTANTFLGNLIPLVKQTISSLTNELPKLVNEILPVVFDLINVIAEQLPPALATFVPIVIDAGLQIISALATALCTEQNLQLVLTAVDSILSSLGNFFENIEPLIPKLVTAALEILKQLALGLLNPSSIEVLITAAMDIVNSISQFIVENISLLITAAVELISALGNGLIENLPLLLSAVIQIVIAIAQALTQGDGLAQITEASRQLLFCLIDTIPILLAALGEALPTIITLLVDFLITNIPVMLEGAFQFFHAIIDAIPLIVTELISALPQIVSAVGEGLKSIPSVIKGIFGGGKKEAVNETNTMSSNLTSSYNSIKTNAESTFSSMNSSISKNSKNAADSLKTNLGSMKNSANTNLSAVSVDADKYLSSFKTSTNKYTSQAATDVSNNMKSIGTSVSTSTDGMKTNMSTNITSMNKEMNTQLNAMKSTVSTLFTAMQEAIADSMKKSLNAVSNMVKELKSAFNFSWGLPKLKLPHVSVSGKFNLDPPKAPKFSVSWYQKGGVFDSPALFGYGNGSIGGLGENGAEAVVPLEKNTQWLDKIAERLKGGGQTVILQVDGKTFGEVAVDSINNITKQTGSLPLRIY